MKRIGWTFIVYVFLALAMSFPACLHLGSHIPKGTDSWQNVWNFWWMGQVLSGKTEHLFHTTLLFYPRGIGLELTNLTFLFSALSAPIQLLASPELALNLFVILSSALCGISTFLLAKRLGLGDIASFFSGMIFAFSPLRMLYALAGQLDTSAMFGLPLCVFLYLRFSEEPGWRSALWLSLCWTLTALISWYQAILVGCTLLLFIAHDMPLSQEVTRGIKRYLLMVLLIPQILLSPITLPMIRAASLEQPPPESAPLGIGASADLLSFILPDPNPTWSGTMLRYSNWHFFAPRKLAENVYGTFSAPSLNKSAFAGYLPMAAAILALCFQRNRRVRRWAWLALIGIIFALGPRLQLGGRLGVPLPYWALAQIPGFALFRCPQRFTFLYLLGISILSGYAVEWLSKRIPAKIRTLFFVSLLALFLIEFAMIPNPFLEDKRTVPSYLSKMTDCPPGPVLDLPVACTPEAAWFSSRYLYLQTVHHRPMVFGYTSHCQGEDLYGLTRRYPVLRDLSVAVIFGESLVADAREKRERDFIIDEGTAIRLKEALEQIRVPCVLLHKNLLGAHSATALSKMLESAFGGPAFEDDTITVFSVKSGKVKERS